MISPRVHKGAGDSRNLDDLVTCVVYLHLATNLTGQRNEYVPKNHEVSERAGTSRSHIADMNRQLCVHFCFGSHMQINYCVPTTCEDVRSSSSLPLIHLRGSPKVETFCLRLEHGGSNYGQTCDSAFRWDNWSEATPFGKAPTLTINGCIITGISGWYAGPNLNRGARPPLCDCLVRGKTGRDTPRRPYQSIWEPHTAFACVRT